MAMTELRGKGLVSPYHCQRLIIDRGPPPENYVCSICNIPGVSKLGVQS